jgi:hypothetical protein
VHHTLFVSIATPKQSPSQQSAGLDSLDLSQAYRFFLSGLTRENSEMALETLGSSQDKTVMAKQTLAHLCAKVVSPDWPRLTLECMAVICRSKKSS